MGIHRGVRALVVTAIFLGSAVTAQAAQAAAEFHADAEPVLMTGEQLVQNKFTFVAGNVKCKVARFEATSAVKTFTTASFHPTYAECTAFGAVAVVNTAGCNYLLHTKETVEGGVTATVDVVCAGAPITIEVPAGNCKVTIPSQENLAHIILSNTNVVTNEKDVDANLTIAGLEYIVDGPGAICGPLGKANNGAITGTWTIRGFEDKGGIEGAQVGLWVE